MNIDNLRRRIDGLLEKVEQQQAARKTCLTLPDWHTLRSMVIRAAMPYPDAARALLAAIEQVEQVEYASWPTMRETIFFALKPYPRARLAIAQAALMQHRENAV